MNRYILDICIETGNSWGIGANGIGCIGCGPQEEFYACADVRISEQGGHVAIPTTPAPPTSTSVSWKAIYILYICVILLRFYNIYI